jgi:AGCS family alanine or glycine:cation symporter
MEALTNIFDFYNNNIGPFVLICLLLPTGVLLSVLLKCIQIRRLGHAVGITAGIYDDPKDEGDISHFQALCAALSATVGIGNIVGVALAVHFGGPGAVFWMWVTGLLGMGLKYSECTLALKYRDVNRDGSVSGGPMYYIHKALGKRYGKPALIGAAVFAGAGIICSFGTGNMAQSNSMAHALHASYNVPKMVSGLIIAGLVFLVIVGGIKRIGAVASMLVPFMAAFYILSAVAVLWLAAGRIPAAFELIFTDAFSGRAVGGGFLWTAIWGIRRGLFSNEAGQGSAPIAHAAAKTKHPVREGLVAMLEPLVDTLLICTMTALVIILCGDYLELRGAALTGQAFSTGLQAVSDKLDFLGIQDVGREVVTLGTVLFALSTSISWSYYGDRCVEYLIRRVRANDGAQPNEQSEKKKNQILTAYRALFCVFLFIGAVWKLKLVWSFVDMVITLMALPNLIALILLRKDIVATTKKYFARKHLPFKKQTAFGGPTTSKDK